MALSPPFRYAERPPAPVIAPWFDGYWEFSVRPGAPSVHHVPPDGCTSIMIAISGPRAGVLLVTGPWVRPLAVPVEPGIRYVGMRLRPGAATPILRVAASTLRDRTAPAAPLLGVAAESLTAGLLASRALDDAAQFLDVFWSKCTASCDEVDPLVAAAAEMIAASSGAMSIADLAAAIGTSPRTLHRRFRAGTALAPKQFARIRRLRAAGSRLIAGATNWGRIAASAGYADQPHLSHEVAQLTGLTPNDFSARVRATEHDWPGE